MFHFLIQTIRTITCFSSRITVRIKNTTQCTLQHPVHYRYSIKDSNYTVISILIIGRSFLILL